MDYIKKHGLAIGIIVAIVVLGGLFIYNNQQVADSQKKQETAKAESEKKQAEEKKAEQEKTEVDAKTKSKDYTFAVAAGDNYTYLARRAVQEYAQANGVTLDKSQIVAAETTLAQKAGWIAVDVNQNITLANADVKAAVDEVKTFSAEQKAAWDVYAAYVVL